jgi:hypothetical protein
MSVRKGAIAAVGAAAVEVRRMIGCASSLPVEQRRT